MVFKSRDKSSTKSEMLSGYELDLLVHRGICMDSRGQGEEWLVLNDEMV